MGPKNKFLKIGITNLGNGHHDGNESEGHEALIDQHVHEGVDEFPVTDRVLGVEHGRVAKVGHWNIIDDVVD